MESPSALFIVINYFNENEVEKFIDHLKSQNAINYSVQVVINGTNENAKLQLIKSSNSNVHLSYPPKNLGYLPGAHFGLKEFIKTNNAFPQLTIVCNTDIFIPNKLFLYELFLSAGIVKGPGIISTKTNLDQNPFSEKRISKFKLKYLSLVFSFYPLYFIYRMISILKGKLVKSTTIEINLKPKNVYALHGSFIAFTNQFFEKGGDLNYPCFLFGEEIFIAETTRKLNLELTYLPELFIKHNEHSSTGTFKSPKLVKYMAQSIKYLLKSYF